jgi:hypothetical protein
MNTQRKVKKDAQSENWIYRRRRRLKKDFPLALLLYLYSSTIGRVLWGKLFSFSFLIQVVSLFSVFLSLSFRFVVFALAAASFMRIQQASIELIRGKVEIE